DAVQTLLDKAVVADNQTDYDAALAEVQQIITADDPPAIYYAQPLSVVAVRKGIAGVVLNPINVGTFYFQAIHPAG
ncbi:MAG: hypothetical protein IT337_06810, partial [Thermomicrobiales bacterium]|nr:hypothetical protein [Thermomicrobiales bacterium]